MTYKKDPSIQERTERLSFLVSTLAEKGGGVIKRKDTDEGMFPIKLKKSPRRPTFEREPLLDRDERSPPSEQEQKSKFPKLKKAPRRPTYEREVASTPEQEQAPKFPGLKKAPRRPSYEREPLLDHAGTSSALPTQVQKLNPAPRRPTYEREPLIDHAGTSSLPTHDQKLNRLSDQNKSSKRPTYEREQQDATEETSKYLSPIRVSSPPRRVTSPPKQIVSTQERVSPQPRQSFPQKVASPPRGSISSAKRGSLRNDYERRENILEDEQEAEIFKDRRVSKSSNKDSRTSHHIANAEVDDTAKVPIYQDEEETRQDNEPYGREKGGPRSPKVSLTASQKGSIGSKNRKAAKTSHVDSNEEFYTPRGSSGVNYAEQPRKSKGSQKGSAGNRSRRSQQSQTEVNLGFHGLEETDDDEADVRSVESVILPSLDEEERLFHLLVEKGDVAEVEQFLKRRRGFDVNCVSFQNTSALQVAIREGNVDMINFLLDIEALDPTDAVLEAVKNGARETIVAVLVHLEQSRPGLEFSSCPNSTEFADYVTPLMLAALEGKFEIVELLIKRGHHMPIIHHPYCVCEICRKNLLNFDRLKYSRMKLNHYQAVANPGYIFLTSGDPIRTAFELTQDLQAAARMFPQYRNEYEELWKGLRTFSAEIIGCCRTSEEVEIILSQRGGCKSAGALHYPRLQMAIDLLQKEFVAHPCTQAVLEDQWTGQHSEWNIQTTTQQVLTIFPRMAMLPAVAVMSCAMPSNKITQSWNIPYNKFLSFHASYLIFLLLLFIENAQDKSKQTRGPPNTGIEALIVLYVVGLILMSIRLYLALGPSRFFTDQWNLFDCLNQGLFVCTFILWIAAAADVAARGDRDLPRMYWNAADPTLLGECFFALATIMAYCRIFMPLSLNYYIGPVQISVGKMTPEIIKLGIVLTLLTISFSAGMSHFYQPYNGMVQTDLSTGSNTSQISSFVDMKSTLRTFFWTIFGMAPLESADVVIANLPEGHKTGINTHEYTEGVGYFIFAVFQFLAVVVIMNMLIALMSNTFTKVMENLSVEWVFGRTKVYVSYLYHSALPPPFNLIPTASSLNSALTWMRLLMKADPKEKATCSLAHCCYILKHSNEKQIRLKNLEYEASDYYSCSVSTETPIYTKQSELVHLTVFVRQQENPEISLRKESYTVGEVLILNCTSAPAIPAPAVTWLVNGQKVEFERLQSFHQGRHSHGHMNLNTSTTQLTLDIADTHVAETGYIELTCVSTIPAFLDDDDETFVDKRTQNISVEVHKVQPIIELQSHSGSETLLCSVFVLILFVWSLLAHR